MSSAMVNVCAIDSKRKGCQFCGEMSEMEVTGLQWNCIFVAHE